MLRNDLIRLQHMLDAANEAISFASGKSPRDLAHDRMMALSIVKSIEIIGEAAAKVSQETRKKYPAVPWATIVAMRNRLIHVYFDIDLDRVWDTLTDDLPPLIAKLEEALNTEKKA